MLDFQYDLKSKNTELATTAGVNSFTLSLTNFVFNKIIIADHVNLLNKIITVVKADFLGRCFARNKFHSPSDCFFFGGGTSSEISLGTSCTECNYAAFKSVYVERMADL